MSESIKILGHIVSSEGIRMDPEKISAVSDRKPPENLKQLQSFLGLCNYYRKFVANYSKKAAPLHELGSPNSRWFWSTQCENAFITLKKSLTSYPILRQPDFDKPFILYTDASTIALGAILAQVDEKNKLEYTCFYASRLLKGSERNYSITELECLAVVWGINYFRIYLYGHKFSVVTDHYSLKWLLTNNNPNVRLSR